MANSVLHCQRGKAGYESGRLWPTASCIVREGMQEETRTSLPPAAKTVIAAVAAGSPSRNVRHWMSDRS